MKNLFKYVLILLCLQLSTLTTLSAIAGDDEDSVLPPQHTEAGVMYVNGGIGNDEQQAIKTMRKDFNLEMTFATKNGGEFMSDIHLKIEDKSGKKVFKSGGIGPMFLIKLAPGTYTVMAKSRDQMQSKTITVGDGGIKNLYFYW